jgi:hypothetical protein
MATNEKYPLSDIGPFAMSHLGKTHEQVLDVSWNSPMNGRDFKAWHLRDGLCAVLGPLPKGHVLFAGERSYSSVESTAGSRFDFLQVLYNDRYYY